VSLLPIFLRLVHKHGYREIRACAVSYWQGRLNEYRSVGSKVHDGEDNFDPDASPDTCLLVEDDTMTQTPPGQSVNNRQEILTVRETALLSLEFCLLWFIANYFVAACLTYTSVASSTILTSTSSIWTLIFGAFVRVEKFSLRKLVGVLASLAGIVLISSVDLSGDNDGNRGSFPHKSQRQIAIGDSMAFFSALMYGVYTVVMKKRIGNEDRVNMPLFFGMVGLFNVIFLWPGFLVLHFTGVETFEMPPTQKIWMIIVVCCVSLPTTIARSNILLIRQILSLRSSVTTVGRMRCC
jgi:solute carrier family 35 protein F5